MRNVDFISQILQTVIFAVFGYADAVKYRKIVRFPLRVRRLLRICSGSVRDY